MSLEHDVQHPAVPPPASFTGSIGIARADVTPPVGIYARNWGAAQHDAAESIHRSLTLTALTLAASQDDSPLVLVDVHLGWGGTLPTFHRFRDRVLKEFSLSETEFIFALTHTHAAVTLSDANPDGAGSELVGPYLESVFETTVATIHRALENAVGATLEWNTGRCGLATTRDLCDPDPQADRVICGYDPSVPADDTLLVGRVTDTDGNVLATLTNYACHPTTLAWDNKAISPDYPGAMRATIEEATGVPALFLQGASGELAPRYQYVGDTDVADRHGRQLAYASLAALADMEPPGTTLQYDGVVESGAPLAVWKHQSVSPSTTLRALCRHVEMPLKDWPSADELEAQRQACTDRALEERLRRRRDVRRTVGDGTTYPLPVWAWRIGDAVLVGTLAENYSLLQRELRSRFPDRTILCMNLINGSIGYLPPDELYDLDLYQVWQTTFARGGLETMIEAMAEMISELTGDTGASA